MRTYISAVRSLYGTEKTLIEGSIPFYGMINPRWFSRIDKGLFSVGSNMLADLLDDQTRSDLNWKAKSMSVRTDFKGNGLIFAAGNTFMGMNVHEDKRIPLTESNYKFPMLTSPNILAGKLANELGFHDYVMTDSTACISSANALTLANMLIKSGRLDRVLIVSLENPIYTPTSEFFTKTGACLTAQDEYGDKIQPSAFDDINYGFNLGQGCGLMLIESHRVAEDPIAEILASSTVGEKWGSYVSQDPAGTGYKKAIADVLFSVGCVPPSEISCIKTHGSGTSVNNKAEGSAIFHWFEEEYTKCTSFKPEIGHTFGPSFLIEFDLLSKAYETGYIPAIANRTDHDDWFVSHSGHAFKTPNVLFLAAGMSNVFNATLVRYMK